MRVFNVRPAADNGRGRATLLGIFDAELSSDLKLFRLALKRCPDGRLRAYAPNKNGVHVAIFSLGLSERLARAAYSELQGGHQPHDERRSAA